MKTHVLRKLTSGGTTSKTYLFLNLLAGGVLITGSANAIYCAPDDIGCSPIVRSVPQNPYDPTLPIAPTDPITDPDPLPVIDPTVSPGGSGPIVYNDPNAIPDPLATPSTVPSFSSGFDFLDVVPSSSMTSFCGSLGGYCQTVAGSTPPIVDTTKGPSDWIPPSTRVPTSPYSGSEGGGGGGGTPQQNPKPQNACKTFKTDLFFESGDPGALLVNAIKSLSRQDLSNADFSAGDSCGGFLENANYYLDLATDVFDGISSSALEKYKIYDADGSGNFKFDVTALEQWARNHRDLPEMRRFAAYMQAHSEMINQWGGCASSFLSQFGVNFSLDLNGDIVVCDDTPMAPTV